MRRFLFSNLPETFIWAKVTVFGEPFEDGLPMLPLYTFSMCTDGLLADMYAEKARYILAENMPLAEAEAYGDELIFFSHFEDSDKPIENEGNDFIDWTNR
jgi:hypothetical protein